MHSKALAEMWIGLEIRCYSLLVVVSPKMAEIYLNYQASVRSRNGIGGAGALVGSLVTIIIGLAISATMFAEVARNNTTHTGSVQTLMNTIPIFFFITLIVGAFAWIGMRALSSQARDVTPMVRIK